MHLYFILTSLLLFTSGLNPVFPQKSTKTSEEKALEQSATYSGLKFRSIGPAMTSGRIGDIAVNPTNFNEWYVAVASGGVWKTQNAGITFEPIFDSQGSYSIGCVSIDPTNPHTVWVGTGENNNQRSVAYGDGVYKSTDGGKSWKNMGLKNSAHIGMIRVHPSNSNIVYVAAYGPLWSSGGERGLYKSEDGGETWNCILEIDEHTGVNEVHLDPRFPDHIYAAAHQRRRHVWTYVGGGPGSGVHKSEDGGKTWKQIENGLPSKKMGRIGMAISPVNPDVVYAIVEAEDGKSGFYRSINRGASWDKQSSHSTSGNYYQEIYCDPKDLNKVYTMDTYSHVTLDGGKTFTRLSENKKHVDNHCMWINPNNTNHYIIGSDGGLYITFDNAKNWQFLPNLPVTQFYRIAVDNALPFYNVFGGTQDNFSLGGPSRTIKKSGIENADWFVTNEGDGFQSQIDPKEPNIVYAQAQYGWLVRYDKNSGEKLGIKPQPPAGEAYRWNWDAPLIISEHNNKRLYFAANKVFRSNDRGNSWEVISPDLSRQLDRNKLPVMDKVWGMDAVMKNASTTVYGNITALAESPKNAGHLVAGTDDGLIHHSFDDGKTWGKTEQFPGVPTRTYVNKIVCSQHTEKKVFAVFNNHKNGDFKPYLHQSLDGGKSWESITGNLPERGSVYAFAEDHIKPNLWFVGTEFGVYFSVDEGNNWIQLKTGLPTISVRDLAIQKRENDLVVGTFGRGIYILDDYSPLREIDSELVKKEAHIFNIKEGLIFFETAKYGYSDVGFQGAQFYSASNPPMGVTFSYYLKETPKTRKEERKAKEDALAKKNEAIPYPSFDEMRAEDEEEKPYLLFSIRDASGNEIRRITSAPSKGINRIVWDGKLSSNHRTVNNNEPITQAEAAFLALPGKYSVELYLSHKGEIKKRTEAKTFEIKTLNQNSISLNHKDKNAFVAEIESVRRRAQASGAFAKELSSILNDLKAAIRNTPGTALRDLNKIDTLQSVLKTIDSKLYGDKSLAKREFETTPSIMNRIGTSVYTAYNNQQDITLTQKQDIEIAKKQLSPINAELKRIGNETEALLNKNLKLGIPYPKNKLPE